MKVIVEIVVIVEDFIKCGDVFWFNFLIVFFGDIIILW